MSFTKAIWTFLKGNIAEKLVKELKLLWNKKGQRTNTLTSPQKCTLNISIIHRESQNTTLVISKLHCKLTTLIILHNYTLYNSQISFALLSLTLPMPQKISADTWFANSAAEKFQTWIIRMMKSWKVCLFCFILTIIHAHGNWDQWKYLQVPNLTEVSIKLLKEKDNLIGLWFSFFQKITKKEQHEVGFCMQD